MKESWEVPDGWMTVETKVYSFINRVGLGNLVKRNYHYIQAQKWRRYLLIW